MKFRHSMFAVLALTSTYAYPTPSSTDEARGMGRAPASGVDAQKATESARRHAEEMNKGKDHEAARDATHSSADGEKMAARARRHTEEMNKGKDHEAARDAASK
jgi:hypothetical protein